jgi:uncharacterized membrane protein YjjP (DUF1212 family)
MGSTEPSDDLAALDYFAELGTAMIRSGESIDLVKGRLDHVADALELDDLETLILPTVLLVQYGPTEHRNMRMVTAIGPNLRLDQVAAVYELADDTVTDGISAAEAHGRLHRILDSSPIYGPVLRTLGLGVLSVGFSLSLQPTPFGVAVAFSLGIVVGLLQLIAVRELRAAVPVIASFLVAAAVFQLAQWYDGENPVRSLIPPLVIFLPGAMLTTGTVELAAGQMISGAGRLVSGMVTLLLLAMGIIAGATLVGATSFDLVDRPTAVLGAWSPWVGLLVITAGNHLYHCAPRRTLPWILLVLLVAYTGQAIGGRLFNPEISGFFGALAMTPLVLAIGRSSRISVPSMVLFLPGFWLLVPGATGLLDITQLVGTNATVGAESFIGTLVTIMAIALGVLLGSAISTAGWRLVTTERILPH